MDIVEVTTDALCTFCDKTVVVAGLLVSLTLEMTGIDGMSLYILSFLIATDYITGLVKAFVHHNLKSRIGIRGILKKLMLIVAVAVAHHLDLFFGYDGTIRTVILSMLVVNESISCFENLEALGFKYPEKIKKMLEQLRK